MVSAVFITDTIKTASYQSSEQSAEISVSSATGLSFLSSNKPIPKLSSMEHTEGRIIGTGEFSTIHEVTSIDLDSNYTSDDADEEAIRIYLSQNYLRDGNQQYRYAVKKLRCDTVTKLKERGKMDVDLLGTELRVLKELEHPNIIKLRAISNLKTTHPSFCLVLDRLSCILSDKIYGEWRKKLKRLSKRIVFEKMFPNKKKLVDKRLFFHERMLVAYDLASAFRYLHDRRIIYRDLKPENVGFDVRGDVKLFDFGLAREMPASGDAGGTNYNESYQMTGHAGTLRYMAPEVALNKLYNLSADVYSFGILCWEIFKCEKPYDKMSKSTHHKDVVLGNVRPCTRNLVKECPKLLINILEECWSENPLTRPCFDDLARVIQEEAYNLSHSKNSAMSRSILMMQRSLHSVNGM